MPHIEVINAMADGWDTEDFEMICINLILDSLK